MRVVERWYLYDGDTLIKVYTELPLLEQDAAEMTFTGVPTVEKVVETHTVHAFYGVGSHPMPEKRKVKHPVTHTPVSYHLVSFDPNGRPEGGEDNAMVSQVGDGTKEV